MTGIEPRRQRDPNRRDAGVSLIEMVVAAALLSLVLGIVGTLFVNISRTTGDARTTRSAMGVAQTTMNELRRVVRVATDNPIAGGVDPAVVSATGSALTLYSFTDVPSTASPSSPFSPAPTQVAFTVGASGNLVETTTPATWNGTYWVFTGAATTRALPGPLMTTGAVPLFTYLDPTGAAIVPGSSGLTAAQRAAVASITITTTVSTTTQRGTADPVVLTDTVGLTNLLSGVN